MHCVEIPIVYASSKSVIVSRHNGDTVSQHVDTVAEEVPVALEYNGIAHAVMLASPADLEDFSLGFSLSEGIINRAADLYDCEVIEEMDGIRVAMQIATEQFVHLKEKRRTLAGRTGCGLCGAESLQQVVRRPAPVASCAVLDGARLQDAFLNMERLQLLQQRTGASHAAGWLDAQRGMHVIREDVGRHNALDKLVGALARQGADMTAGCFLITSRASYEMVQKAATAGVGVLAAISAPTALAIQLAESCGVMLIGFARGAGYVVYTHPERLNQPEKLVQLPYENR